MEKKERNGMDDLIFKYLINEKKNVDIPPELSKYIKKIKENCSQIIKVYKKENKLLYRGMYFDDPTKDFIKKKPRKHRKPSDTTEFATREMDKRFYKKFGWKPRTEGVFATGSLTTAESYGRNLAIFFPFDGYKYIWSSKIRDFYESTSYSHMTKTELLRMDKNEVYKEFDKIIKTYTDKYLSEAIWSLSEIMFKCDYYYAMDYNFVVKVLEGGPILPTKFL